MMDRVNKFQYTLAFLIFIALFSSCKKENSSFQSPPLNDAFGLAVPYLSHTRPVDIQTRYDMGIRWVRRDIAWSSIERTRGVFDYSEYDAPLDAEMNAGVNVLGLLVYGNTIYNSDPEATDNHPPDTLEYFGNFVTQTVLHFKDKIHVWEIWNEPNGPTFWKPAPDPVAFGKLVLIAAHKIREADPQAKIMLGGMVGNSDPIFFSQRAWGFTEDLLKAYPELVGLIDIYAIHPYTFLQHPSPEEPTLNKLETGYKDMLTEFRRILNAASAANKPIWATELGWHTATQAPIFRGVTEDLQGAYLVRACVIAFSQGIQKVFPYTYSDGPGDLTVSEDHFGLMRYLENTSGNLPHEPKPSYYAYKNLIKQLSDKQFTKDLRYELFLPDNIYAYQFNNMIIAWTTKETEQDLTLHQLPAEVYSLNGDPIPVDSKIIKVSKYPVYIYL